MSSDEPKSNTDRSSIYIHLLLSETQKVANSEQPDLEGRCTLTFVLVLGKGHVLAAVQETEHGR